MITKSALAPFDGVLTEAEHAFMDNLAIQRSTQERIINSLLRLGKLNLLGKNENFGACLCIEAQKFMVYGYRQVW